MLGVLRVLGEGVSPAGGEAASGVATTRRRAPVSPPPPTASARGEAPRPPSARAPARTAPTGATPTAAAAWSCTLGGASVQLDQEGFMLDRTQWSPAVAEALAHEAGLAALTGEHWRIIEFCREDAGASGAAPGMRRITSRLGVPARDLYRLFPGGPGILAARIAGLGKPKSCV